MHPADSKYLSKAEVNDQPTELSGDGITKDALPQNESEHTSLQGLNRSAPFQKLTSRWFAAPCLLFAGGNGYIHMFTHTQHED